MKSNLAWFGYKIYEERIWPQDKLQQLIAIFIKIEVRKIDEGDFNVLLSIEIKMVKKTAINVSKRWQSMEYKQFIMLAVVAHALLHWKVWCQKILVLSFDMKSSTPHETKKKESNLYLPLFIKNWFKHLCSAYVHERQTSLS